MDAIHIVFLRYAPDPGGHDLNASNFFEPLCGGTSRRACVLRHCQCMGVISVHILYVYYIYYICAPAGTQNKLLFEIGPWTYPNRGLISHIQTAQDVIWLTIFLLQCKLCVHFYLDYLKFFKFTVVWWGCCIRPPWWCQAALAQERLEVTNVNGDRGITIERQNNNKSVDVTRLCCLDEKQFLRLFGYCWVWVYCISRISWLNIEQRITINIILIVSNIVLLKSFWDQIFTTGKNL